MQLTPTPTRMMQHPKSFRTDGANAWFFDYHLPRGTPREFRFHLLPRSSYSLYQFATPRNRFASGSRSEMVTMIFTRWIVSLTSSGVIDHLQVLRSWPSLIPRRTYLCTNGWFTRCLSPYSSHPARNFRDDGPRLEQVSSTPAPILCAG